MSRPTRTDRDATRTPQAATRAARTRVTATTSAVAVLVALAACTGDGSGPVDPAPSGTEGTPGTDVRDGTEQWRPAVHYSPAENWMNDPNGLVFHDGTYHLYYQYNPNGSYWGDMSWGHATSTDLVEWTEQPLAMEATADAEIFSGSVVVDEENTSGLGEPGNPAFVALYTRVYGEATGHEPGTQAQALAYSLDEGRTWQQHDGGEPVLTLEPESTSFRDPKVLWYEPGGYWVMAAVVADDQVVKLYRSDDLLSWDWLSDVEGFGVGADDPAILWEMPDLFPVRVDGTDEERWVLLLSVNPGSVAGGSGMQYFVGDFDGTTFVPDDVAPAGSDLADFDWVDHGADFYAATTVSGAPDDRRVVIGWMSNWDYATDVPTTPWRGAMGIPRDLGLTARDGDVRLTSRIADEARATLDAGAVADVGDLTVDDGTHPLGPGACADVQLVELSLDPGSARTAGLVVRAGPDGERGARVVYDAERDTLTLDRSAAGVDNFSDRFSREHVVNLPLGDQPLDLTVLVDRGSVEVFADDGRTAVTDLVLPPTGDRCVALVAEGGEATFQGVTITTL
ncbi:glycoside hydrolase family 32 protein [Cellulosimicrobium cellulans]|uniref:glycoside hydrolase family 32 protein n=1 Tax=Cellulosimicrobium cellulans TaxID=1710 RepID=UPI001EDA4418|nr:glycoside hydrolase family 32 protein [Cellulosimicrobium cellulans]UKJ62997.1 glycoside hydrolase family 32 protein [Cellulosimicrobium cellulans]